MRPCPVCKKMFDEVHIVHHDQPFMAYDPMEGLLAYSAISVPKIVLCQTDRFVHFRFEDTGDERLVEMVGLDPDRLERQRMEQWDRDENCWHEGCELTGKPVYMQTFDDEPAGYYCHDHTTEEGFCPGCRMFCAGSDPFDVTRLCAACTEELEAEMSWDDEEYDDYWEYPAPWYDPDSSLDELEDEPTHRYIGPRDDDIF